MLNAASDRQLRQIKVDKRTILDIYEHFVYLRFGAVRLPVRTSVRFQMPIRLRGALDVEQAAIIIIMSIDRIVVLKNRKNSPLPLCNAKCSLCARPQGILAMFT